MINACTYLRLKLLELIVLILPIFINFLLRLVSCFLYTLCAVCLLHISYCPDPMRFDISWESSHSLATPKLAIVFNLTSQPTYLSGQSSVHPFPPTQISKQSLLPLPFEPSPENIHQATFECPPSFVQPNIVPLLATIPLQQSVILPNRRNNKKHVPYLQSSFTCTIRREGLTGDRVSWRLNVLD